MKKFMIGSAIVVAALGLTMINTYNRLVPLDEKVNSTYSQYQNQLKRQADLLPMLSDVAKGYMTSEQKTMIDVATARAGDASKLKASDVANNPELQKKLADAQASSSRALASLTVTVERYPELKASENIKTLMTEIAGTQNRVTVARGRNQDSVTEFNREVRVFPGIIIASVIGFGVKPYYKATEEEQNAPKLNFNR